MKVVRFLKAFRNFEGSFLESLKFELSKKAGQVAAMPLDISENDHSLSLVGLLLTPKAVKRVFDGDVWSLSRADGSLYPTNPPRSGSHAEAFCKPDFRALVIDIRAFRKSCLRNLELQADISACIAYAQEYDLAILVLKNGKFMPFKGDL